MTEIQERFLKYVSFDTESSYSGNAAPSTEKQKDLGRFIVKEMKELGIKDAFISEEGCVYGTILGNCEDAPVIGFIAHMDTSPDLTGKNVKPRIVKNYDGNDIILNEELNIVMESSKFENLNLYKGQDLIVTDGTTLLGADDKAGIAEIMNMAEYFLNNPEIKHGTIKLGFTPDEEVGRGTENFDLEKFGADFAYTLDGPMFGGISYENFNAAYAKITIQGASIHPGAAKNKMINSILVAMELNNMLPVFEIPAYTEKREGFNHITDLQGTVEKTVMKYIIRDHDTEKFNQKKDSFTRIVNYINEKYGREIIELELKDSYYNMYNKILPVIHIVDAAKRVMKNMDIEPIDYPMRGGSDGVVLSYKGLPCPDLSAGYHNHHGKYEYISVQSMEKVTEIIINIVKAYTL